MCKKDQCKQPENLPEGKSPKECCPERIAKCHPEAKGHPCCAPKKEKQAD